MARTPFWKLFLDEVTSDHTRHFLWLKSLSYLEYIGYRKMIKSLHHGDVGKGVYHHLTDEIRHSFMLNELAHKTFPSPALPEPQAWEKAIQEIAEDYFQNIDGETEAWVWQTTGEENSLLCYMLVSYLVESGP